MKISPQHRINMGRIATITTCYILFNICLALYNKALLNSLFSLGGSDIYNFKLNFGLNVLIGLIAGILGGSVLVIVNGRFFRRKSFRFAIITTIVSYIFIFIIITAIVTLLNIWAELGKDATFSNIISIGATVIFDAVLFSYFVMWGIIILFTLFLLQVNDKFGPGILVKFIMGKYYQPRKEQRIFMFLDMRSSTTIAEKIGNEKYFDLLNEIFSDITGTILDNEGEIYQYIGDEIVISWPMQKGIQNANFINCFLHIRSKLVELQPKYKRKYGIIPELKAGLHYGQVMAGEVGVIKKDIIYSGDVLNTTARIQEQCNNYGVDILISKETFDLVAKKGAYELIPLGSIELRGKENKIDLNTIKAK
jgi:adenylate cyclase